MKIISVLELLGKSYAISSEIMKRSSLKEYRLDIDSFYKKFGKRTPRGKGYEIQVLNSPEITSWHEHERKLLDSNGRLMSLHVHTGNDDMSYVCYTRQIRKIAKAKQIHKEWARIMFAQIFFGMSDTFLFQQTGTVTPTAWAAYIDKHFKKKECCVKDFRIVKVVF